MFLFIASIGQFTLSIPTLVGRLTWMLLDGVFDVVRVLKGQYRLGALRWVARLIAHQLWYTGVQVLPLIVGIALFFSISLLLLGYQSLQAFGAEGHFGQIFRLGVLTGLGPVMVALIVIARSGTAITADVASQVIRGEIDVIKLHGMSVSMLIVIPRLIGVWVSLLMLTTLFIGTILLGFFIFSPLLGLYVMEILNVTHEALSPKDILTLVVKSSAFGLLIPLLTVHKGLTVKKDIRDLPRVSSQAVVACIISVFVLDVLISTLVLL